MMTEVSSRLWSPLRHRLMRDAHGQLVFTDESGQQHVGVTPVRAFPIDAPGEYVSLVDADGHELAFIARLADIDAESRSLLLDDIAQRDFMPYIEKLFFCLDFFHTQHVDGANRQRNEQLCAERRGRHSSPPRQRSADHRQSRPHLPSAGHAGIGQAVTQAAGPLSVGVQEHLPGSTLS